MARWGTGPVFAYEWKALSRRWQPFAMRAAFVAAILAALAVAWWSGVAGRPMVTAEQRGQVGQAFFGGIVVSMLALVLAVCPAVTCGAISRDKVRGHLELLLVSDLGDAEIVLGKLAAWLAPATGLVLAVMPVAAIAAPIGGIDPVAMTGALLMAAGLAVLGSTLALTLSVWGTRPSEVLLSVYAVWVVWMLGGPAWIMIARLWGIGWPPLWFIKLNPFDLCLLPYWRPNDARWTDGPIFLVACLSVSAVMAAVASRCIRPVAVRQMGGDRSSSRRRPGRRWPPGRSLDRDPIAWRERRRSRPSAWGRALIGLYAALASGFTLLAIADTLRPIGPTTGRLAAYVNAFQVALGLPLLGVWAASALAEERDSGSIVVLMTTPVPTRAIVRAKWWAVARRIPWLLLLPTAVLASLVRWTESWGYWAWAALVLLLLASQAAALVSLGLALATWIRRPPAAMGIYVAIVVGVSLGLGFTAQLLSPGRSAVLFSTVSPFYAAYYGTDRLFDLGPSAVEIMVAQAIWTVAYVAIASLLLLATRCSFERCLGRAPERRRRPAGRIGRPVRSHPAAIGPSARQAGGSATRPP